MSPITSRDSMVDVSVTEDHYLFPKGIGRRPRVTRIIGTISNPNLLAWSTRLAAEYATQDREALALLSDAEAVAQIKGAPTRYLNQSSELGTRVHRAVEEIALHGGTIYDHPEDLRGHLRSWQAFVDAYSPRVLASEVLMVAPSYAGTCDLVLEVDLKDGQGLRTIVVDVKTGKAVHPDSVALQLAAYRYAPSIFVEGALEANPWAETITGGAVLHLRPRSGAVVPIAVGPYVRDRFKALTTLHRWMASDSRDALGKRIPLDPKAVPAKAPE